MCVLLGLGVLFVLREVCGGGSGDGWYELVGECYCHGIMDGEAVTEVARGDVELRDFEIGRSGHTRPAEKISDAVRSLIDDSFGYPVLLAMIKDGSVVSSQR